MPQITIDHDALRQGYLESPPNQGIYIGNPSGLSMHNLKWVPMNPRDGCGHVLADTSHETRSHAILLAVLHITRENCWVYPDGKWRGPTKYTKSLADMKLNCFGEIPEAGVFHDDFQHVIRNLESIRNKIASPGSKKSGVLFPVEIGNPADENGLKIKFHHALFKKKSEGEGSPGVRTRADSNGQHDWNMDNWPAVSDVAKKALKDMKTTHMVDPLPLYDSEGTPVNPKLYHSSLAGATVEVRFNLCHWHFKNEDEDVYSAYIDSIYILPVPETAISHPGRKVRSGHQAEPRTPPRRRAAVRE